MHTYLDAKLMAKALRRALAERQIPLGHSDCLELVARQFGLADWNTLAASIAAASTADRLVLPRDWSVTKQTNQRHYRLGLDPAEAGTVLIESRFQPGGGVDLTGDHYAALMQSIFADDFKGRVRLTARLRTENATAASIWMRVDRSQGHVLRFDNMLFRKEDAALRGTGDWTTVSVVLDAPNETASIHYGLLLQGYGRVWARSFDIERVGEDVAPTAGGNHCLATPSNLDFLEAVDSRAQ